MPQDIFDRLAAEDSVATDLFDRLAMETDEEDKPDLWGRAVRGVKEAGSQFARGLGEAGTSTVEAVGTLTGSDRLKDWAKATEEEMAQFYGEGEGTAGAIGRGTGRILGEVGLAMAGGMGASKLAAGAAARGVKGAQAVQNALTSANLLKRGAATAAVNAPIDIVQGVKQEEGFILPGRLGAVAENVGLSGIAGAVPWERIFKGKPPVVPDAPVTDPARMLPPTTAQAADDIIPGPSVTRPPAVEEVVDGLIVPKTEPWSRQGPARTFAMPPAQPGVWQGPVPPWQGPIEAMQGQARGALPEPRLAGPSIPMGAETPPPPVQSQVRGLLMGTSTETVPDLRTLPGGSNLPPITYQAGQTPVRTPLFPQAARADIPQGPAIPARGEPGPWQGPVRPSQDVLPAQQGQARGLLPSSTTETAPRIIPGSGRYPEMISGQDVVRQPLLPQAQRADVPQGPAIPMRATQQELDAIAEATAERAAIEAAERPSAWDLPMEELAERAGRTPLPKGQKKLAEMPDDDLLDHFVLRVRQAEEGSAADALLEEMDRLLEMNATGRPLGLTKAKQLYGGDIAEIGQLSRFTEEQVEAFRDRGWEMADYLRARAAATRAERGAKTLARLEAEAQRRGLSVARDLEAMDFDPSMFTDQRAGFINTQALTTLAGGGAGALAGAAGAEEGDRGAGAVMGGLIGAGLGYGAGRAVSGAMSRAGRTTPIPAALPEAVPTRKTPDTPMRKAPLTGAVEPDAYLNIERLAPDNPRVQEILRGTTDDAVRQTEVDLRRKAAPGKRGRLVQPETFDDLAQSVADDLGVDVADVVKRTANGEQIGRQDMLRIRTALKQTAEQEAELLKRIDAGAFTTPGERQVAEMMAQQLREDHLALTNTIIKQGTEAARNLNAFRIAALDTADPSIWVARVQQLAKRPVTTDEMAKIWELAGRKNVDGLVALAKEMQVNTPWEKFRTLFKAGLLMQPKTHLANLGGNSAMMFLESVKDIPATIMDSFVAQYTGRRTKAYATGALFRASKRGAQKGFKAAKEVMRTGAVQNSKWTESFREVNFNNPFLDAATKVVFRSLEASDQVFMNVVIAKSLDEQARILAREATKRGVPKTAAEFLAKPTTEMAANALNDALYATFKDNSKLANAALKAREALGPAGDIIAPFAKTPANIADRIIDYSPLGLVSTLTRVMRRGLPDGRAQKQLVEGVARAGVGSALVLGGYLLSKQGLATGFYPSDERERNRWKLEGRQEGSILVDGKWRQVSRLSPVGNMVAVGAAMAEAERNQGVADALFGMLTAPAGAVVDLPMVSGVSDLLDAVNNLGTPRALESTQQFMGRVAQGMIPFSGLVRGTAYGADPYVRETRGGTPFESAALNPIRAALPGVSEGLPVRMDALGRPVERGAGPDASTAGRIAATLMNPVGGKRDVRATDPLVAELSRTGAVVSPVERRKGESAAAYTDRQRAVGSAVEQALTRFIDSPAYARLADAPPERLRTLMEQEGVNTDRISDAQIQARYQGFILEKVATRAKTAAGRQFRDPAGGQRGALIKALTR